MDDIEDYMAVVINDDCAIDYLGYGFNFGYHAECLIDYALRKYPYISGFKNLNYKDDPNSPFYYLTLLNNIIFTNVSVDDGKYGVLYLPKVVSEKQLQTLYDFSKMILDFETYIIYDMTRVNGISVGKAFDFDKKLDLESELDEFVNQKKLVKRLGELRR